MPSNTPEPSRGGLRFRLAAGVVAALLGVGLLVHHDDAGIGDLELASHLEAARAVAAGESGAMTAGTGPSEAPTRPPLGTWLLAALDAVLGEATVAAARDLGAALGLGAALALSFLLRRRGAREALWSTTLVAMLPGFFQVFREGGRGATAVAAVLLAAALPPARLVAILGLAAAALAGGPLALVLVALLRACALPDGEAWGPRRLAASAGALLPLVGWYLLAGGRRVVPFLLLAPEDLRHAGDGSPGPWALLALVALGAWGRAGGVGGRALAGAVAAAAAAVLVPGLRQPWALTLLAVPGAVMVGDALERRRGALGVRLCTLLRLLSLGVAAFVGGWMVSMRPWLAGSAWPAGGALLLGAGIALAATVRRRVAAEPTLACALVAVVILVGFVQSQRPRDPSAVQLGPRLREAAAAGDRFLALDRPVPELAFGAARRIERGGAEAAAERLRRGALWVVGSPAADARLLEARPAATTTRVYRTHSLGRDLVLRRLVPTGGASGR